jgi:hypothetical protein
MFSVGVGWDGNMCASVHSTYNQDMESSFFFNGTGILNSGLHYCKAGPLLLELPLQSILLWLFIYLAVLGFELRAFTLSHSTSPFL